MNLSEEELFEGFIALIILMVAIVMVVIIIIIITIIIIIIAIIIIVIIIINLQLVTILFVALAKSAPLLDSHLRFLTLYWDPGAT